MRITEHSGGSAFTFAHRSFMNPSTETYNLQSSFTVVLKNLLICVILFYAVYYASLSLCCLTLKLYELDVLAPFDFKTTPSWLNTNYRVLLVSTEVTYFVCGLLFVLVVEEWLWDYAISVTVLHVAITSAVMLEFPWTSHWWAALGILELFRFGFF
ncbi:transmembrane protein 244 [Ochotona curzoniae]|uniref:transmembrane protein 244 n=1 Tax=Ochotona curzoniae TaxID=130825 RepID=UPI001B34D817|nr:transmembrane protein 244 [Ochotona curzoniae]